MLGIIRNWLALVGWRLLKNSSQAVWDAFWSTFAWGIGKAEELWEEEGRGEVRKEWVADTIMDMAKQKFDLGWFARRALRIFVNRAVDAAIDGLNKELGKDWVTHAEDLEEWLANKIPFINAIL